MGGYMGFGMQKWIYSRNPRKKFFERDRIPSFTALPKYSRSFSIKPTEPENKRFMGFLTIIIVIAFSIIIYVSHHEFLNYSNQNTKQITEHIENEESKAFYFLISSGKNRLKANNALGAYSEFKLAYKIYPNHKELQELVTETLMVLCNQDESYCAELEGYLYENL